MIRIFLTAMIHLENLIRLFEVMLYMLHTVNSIKVALMMCNLTDLSSFHLKKLPIAPLTV